MPARNRGLKTDHRRRVRGGIFGDDRPACPLPLVDLQVNFGPFRMRRGQHKIFHAGVILRAEGYAFTRFKVSPPKRVIPIVFKIGNLDDCRNRQNIDQ